MKITINGKTYEGQTGSNVSIINNKVYIDGKDITDLCTYHQLLVKIEGNTGDLKVDRGSVDIKGNSKSIVAGGSVSTGDVTGNVETSGSINCNNVGGNIKAGGSVNCNNISGSVVAGGSIVRG